MTYLHVLTLLLCSFSFCFAEQEEKSFAYREELELLKNSSSYKHIFREKDISPELLSIQTDIENYQELALHHRLVRFIFMMLDVLVVTPKTMPKLYAYVEEVCKKAEIPMPTVLLNKQKGFFNAAAQKLLLSTGAIVIGQELLADASDEELEAIVAHEIGHIKYDHVNKTLLVTVQAHYLALGIKAYLSKHKNSMYEVYGQQGNRLVDELNHYSYMSCLRSLMIGKSFEKQADEFAYKTMGKGKGLMQFFERMKEKNAAKEARFAETYEMIEAHKAKLFIIDLAWLKTRYYSARTWDYMNKAIEWTYHHTPFGPHPSHDDRIKIAKRYLKEQEAQRKEGAIC